MTPLHLEDTIAMIKIQKHGAFLSTEVFSRDLYYCYELFARFYPQEEATMRQASEYSLNPTVNKEILIPFINKLGEFLSQEADVDH